MLVKTVKLNNNVGLYYKLGSKVNNDFLDGLVSDFEDTNSHFFDWTYEVTSFDELVNRSRHLLHLNEIDLTDVLDWCCNGCTESKIKLNKDFDSAIMNILGLTESVDDLFVVDTHKGDWFLRVYDDCIRVHSGETSPTKIVCLAINQLLNLKLKTGLSSDFKPVNEIEDHHLYSYLQKKTNKHGKKNQQR